MLPGRPSPRTYCIYQTEERVQLLHLDPEEVSMHNYSGHGLYPLPGTSRMHQDWQGWWSLGLPLGSVPPAQQPTQLLTSMSVNSFYCYNFPQSHKLDVWCCSSCFPSAAGLGPLSQDRGTCASSSLFLKPLGTLQQPFLSYLSPADTQMYLLHDSGTLSTCLFVLQTIRPYLFALLPDHAPHPRVG